MLNEYQITRLKNLEEGPLELCNFETRSIFPYIEPCPGSGNKPQGRYHRQFYQLRFRNLEECIDYEKSLHPELTSNDIDILDLPWVIRQTRVSDRNKRITLLRVCHGYTYKALGELFGIHQGRCQQITVATLRRMRAVVYHHNRLATERTSND